MPEKTMDYVTKSTPDVTGEQIEKLKQLFPECVTEGKVDFDLLQATLGQADALAGDDAYTFTWAGKEEAFRAVQIPSAAALRPAPEESVNFDDTNHLFIEGENLEALKLLYKSYFGRVKLIYIDPPYNTGNDFVYQDDYSEPRQAYLEKTGQADAEGNLLRSNPETAGRYHSDWLTMMYPRLFLARQLLRDDGVIFVSIDDIELSHLRLIMNEIFGPENWLGTFVWKSRQMVDNRTKTGVSNDHEYVLCYGRSDQSVLRGAEKDLSKFGNPDNDPRGPWRSADLTGLATKDRRPNLHYDLRDPETGIVYPCPKKGWRYDRETMQQKIEEERILFPSGGKGRPRHKLFLEEMDSIYTGFSTMITDVHTTHGTRDVLELFDEPMIQFPKPVDLIKRFVEQAAFDDDIVLDFFAGSATTAQAVLELNQEDGQLRRFIMVQFPEATPEDSPAQSAGFETIAEVGKERIRRVLAEMQETEGDDGQLALDMDEGPADLGFKVFKLAPSTFQQWEPPEEESDEALEEQLALFEGGLEPDADPLDVIYEVILKEGYSLNAHIEALDLETNQFYRVTDEGDDKTLKVSETFRVSTLPPFYVCLDDEIDPGTIEALDLDEETAFVCLDTALDDSQKVNLAMACRLKVI